MATIFVTLHTAAYIDEADGAYVLGKRAAYKMTVALTDANQATADAAQGGAVTLTGVSATAWSRVNGIGGAEIVLGSPPTGLTVSLGVVSPDNVATGQRRVHVDSTPPGADHDTRWVGWATVGTVFTGAPVVPTVDVPPNFLSPGTGLAVLKFNNLACAGVPIVQSVERPVWFGIGNGDLIPGGGEMSVSCRGALKIPSAGSHRFLVQSDEGCRLWLDGAVFIDDWGTSYGDRYSGVLVCTAGQIVNIRAEMLNTSNATSFQINWSLDGAPYVPVPVTAMYPIGWDEPLTEAARPVQAAFGVEVVKRYFP